MNTAAAHLQIEEVFAGVDWLSATLLKEGAASAAFGAYCDSCIRAIGREGHELEDRSLLGFRGIKAGGCFSGENEHRYYVQLSGEYADRYYQQIDRYTPHYSRIDLQVTVRYVNEQKAIAKEVYRDFISGNSDIPTPRRRKGYLIVGSDGGDTVYLGAPSSRQRCRIYNKAKQSERAAYERCWRYEVVLRDELARDWAFNAYHFRPSLAPCVLSTVGGWLEARGVAVPFDYGRDVVVLPKMKTLPSDIERKLEWLRTQVAPTVEYLTECGYRDSVLLNLGIVLRPDDA